MNLTISAPDSPTEETLPVATASPKTDDLRRRRPRATRFSLLVLTAMAVFASGLGLTAATASATPVITPYFSMDSTVTCDQFRNTVRVTISAGPQPGYAGMTAQFRVYSQFGSSGSWTPWSANVRLWSYGQLLNVTSSATDNQHVRVYVEMRYWTGSRWSAAQGNWATPYLISHVDRRTPYYNGFCYT